MTHNLSYGDKVSQLLNSNHIWAEFRDQKHDLFITDTNVRGYLTGKTAIIIFDFDHFSQINLHELIIFFFNLTRSCTDGRLFDTRSKQKCWSINISTTHGSWRSLSSNQWWCIKIKKMCYNTLRQKTIVEHYLEKIDHGMKPGTKWVTIFRHFYTKEDEDQSPLNLE